MSKGSLSAFFSVAAGLASAAPGVFFARGRLDGLRLLLGLGRGLLLVALLRQRRRDALPQDDEVHVARAPHVGVRLGEPVLHRPCVRRAEQVEVLAALVEHRLGDLAEPFRHRERAILRQRVSEQRRHERLRAGHVCDPRRIGRPTRPQRVGDGVDAVAADPLDGARREIDVEQRLRVVGEGDLLAVRRPQQAGVGPRTPELDPRDVALAVLGTHVQRVLARLVGEVREPRAVRRPARVALVRGRRVRHVPRVALLGGQRDDLAAEFHDEPRARR